MKRIPFSQVLKNASIDLRREYDRLYALFYVQRTFIGTKNSYSLRDFCASYFTKHPFRGTCISLEDFDDFYGYHFEKEPSEFDIDYLVSFGEYSYNILYYYQTPYGDVPFVSEYLPIQFYLDQVSRVIEDIGYMENHHGYVIDFVPKDQAAISVAEIVDKNLSYRVIEYNHHTMKGDLDRKKATLIVLADKLEPRRSELKTINPNLEDDLFFLFNNVNLRHNNIDPNGKNYEKTVSAMKNCELEKWYDNVYQMCLLAFLELDHIERKNRVKKLKKDIKNSK